MIFIKLKACDDNSINNLFILKMNKESIYRTLIQILKDKTVYIK